jgi:hypothetical protein
MQIVKDGRGTCRILDQGILGDLDLKPVCWQTVAVERLEDA